MIPRIKKILYATDLSKNSAYAFRYAINTAQKHEAEVVTLHVIEPLPQNAQIWMDLYVKDNKNKYLEENMKKAAETIRERWKIIKEKELADYPESAVREGNILVEEGYPAEVILRVADENNCDVIVMGTHSKGAVMHTFLGSVAERVLRRTRKPVFIIPLPKGETDISFHTI
ncbi:MAG: universal stress protein [Syntrophales bacterium]|jgi:nucleotide-binding universal stress UspA family protein|nr:universal stress protein [Syntrophales bacterium]MDY0043421.1 universal stress protein [Syntrophales bacterium]